jgi:hypothetical protein
MMKPRPTQFGARENTASPRQHAPRPSDSPSQYESRVNLLSKSRRKISVQRMSSSGELFRSSLSEARKRTTGEERSDTCNPTIAGRERERKSAIAPASRIQFRCVSIGQFDLNSTAEARDLDICIAPTHESNQERGGLP